MSQNPDDFQKPKLPTPKIPDLYQRLTTPHFSTPAGMLLKGSLQPPPMYGLRGSTIAPKFLPKPAPTYKELVMERPAYKKPVVPPPLPEPSVFCDFCDRSFRTTDQLDKHKMQTHRELMGIKPRVYTPEEINEWKEARKKRYPTTQNILARQQAQEERIKRGERLQESKSRFGRKEERRQPTQKRENHDNSWQERKKKFPPSKKFVPIEPVEEPKTVEEDAETLNGLPKFKGTSTLTNYERTLVLKQTSALSFLGSYGSGSESDEEEIEENPLETPKNEIPDDERPEETPIVKIDPFTDAEIASTPNHEPPPKDVSNENSSKKRQRKRKHSKDETQTEEIAVETEKNKEKVPKPRPSSSKRQAQRPPWYSRYRRYQNTMLEKLLQPEIRHERNVLLQCVRFVVENKFFGIGSENSCTENPALTEENTSNNDKNE
ncbi:FMR1-interacting protein NUFIP1 [Culicoides brevitarsis]|uniref:FMR1-interacting protein NUFIP1 n=1 Tax=Culicoides brevitarsis TaxID=469753 RepID=UPI00307C29EA